MINKGSLEPQIGGGSFSQEQIVKNQYKNHLARKAKTCVEASSGSVDLSSLSSGVGRSHRADTRGGVEILHWNKFREQSMKMFFLETGTAKRV